MKTLFFNRKSVCMADDTEDHRIQLLVNDNCSYSEMIKRISEIHFLPSYDTIWLIQSNRRALVAAYYNSSYSNGQPHVIWQHGFNENEEISDGDSFYFDCHIFKRELYKYSHEYDKTVESIKNKYNISEKLFQQINDYLTKIRTK